MARYIDADRIKYYFDRETLEHDEAFKWEIDKIPTADVAPVRHAHWEYFPGLFASDGVKGCFVCSACKVAIPEAVYLLMDGFYKDFCGACGARMDEEDK